MGGRVGCRLGGILGLHRLLREHGEAIEYDLITLDRHRDWLGTERLTWRDLLVIVRQLPAGSALDRSQRGAESDLRSDAYLLGMVVNLLQTVSWQLAGDPKAPKPEPFLLPGQQAPTGAETTTSHKGRGMTIDEVNRLLGWDQVSASTTEQVPE